MLRLLPLAGDLKAASGGFHPCPLPVPTRPQRSSHGGQSQTPQPGRGAALAGGPPSSHLPLNSPPGHLGLPYLLVVIFPVLKFLSYPLKLQPKWNKKSPEDLGEGRLLNVLNVLSNPQAFKIQCVQHIVSCLEIYVLTCKEMSNLLWKQNLHWQFNFNNLTRLFHICKQESKKYHIFNKSTRKRQEPVLLKASKLQTY